MADFPCTPIDSPAKALELKLPGGISISSVPVGNSVLMTELAQVNSLLAQLGPALGALTPALRVIDAVTAMFAVLQKAPEIPVDPTGFFEALADAAEKVAKLTPLIPQVSIPATIASTLKLVERYARAIATELGKIQTVTDQAQALLDTAQAAGDTALAAQAQCALDNSAAMLEHAQAAMGPLGGILGIVTGLMSFIPSPVELPAAPDPAGLAAGELAELLGTIADALGAIKIPGA